MRSLAVVVWCLAYILGLLMTAVQFGSAIVFICSLICALILPRMKPKRTIAKIWIIAGVIGLAAGFYLQFRTPQPSAIDISQFVPKERQEVTVSGTVETLPKLTRSGNSQIWLNVNAFGEQKADGKLYVTLSKVNGQDLY
ncbi:DUF4131 domain-containing protein, partial [Pseudanabaenaceae cyanobacterium LEGE 13415]|nr:DUF4131 domain-containing protein [Pseudanabaenaceae cyanobacterium LEGE 13415]